MSMCKEKKCYYSEILVHFGKTKHAKLTTLPLIYKPEYM